MIKCTFDDRKLQAKVRKAQGDIQKIVDKYGDQVILKAQEILRPIYEDPGDWPLSGRLKGDIDSEPIEGGTGVVIFNEVPYARIRHYENKTHPSTTGYFSKALFKIRQPMKNDIRNLLKSLDD